MPKVFDDCPRFLTTGLCFSLQLCIFINYMCLKMFQYTTVYTVLSPNDNMLFIAVIRARICRNGMSPDGQWIFRLVLKPKTEYSSFESNVNC